MTNNTDTRAPGLTKERIYEIAENCALDITDQNGITYKFGERTIIDFAAAIEREVRADVERWAASHAAASAVPAYEQDLLDIVRSFCSTAQRLTELTPQQREHYPSPLSPMSPLFQAASAACVERGYTEWGLAVEGVEYPAATPSTAAVPAAEWISVDERLPTNTCLAVYQPHLRGHKPRVIRAVYFKQYQVKATGDECDSEYNEADDMEYVKAGWYERIDNWGDFASVAVCEGTVTHWMEIPVAPVPAADGGNRGEG